MSFSNDVKEELFKIIPGARHCRIAELASLVCMGAGTFGSTAGEAVFSFDNRMSAEKAATLIKRLFEETVDVESSKIRNTTQYRITTRGELATGILKTVKIKTSFPTNFKVDNSEQNKDNIMRNGVKPDAIVYQQTCCKRAFLRGAFLSTGSISDPEKDYHLEFSLCSLSLARMLVMMMNEFEVDARIITRKKAYIVYIKDSEMISLLLTVMDARVALMNLENIRILKDMRNAINRRVNCETANIEKTVRAAGKQVEDIMFLRDKVGFEDLSDDLKMTAQLRLEHPDISLAELAAIHPQTVSRSGINHRLKKLSDMADKLRERG